MRTTNAFLSLLFTGSILSGCNGRADEWPPEQLGIQAVSESESKLELGRNVYVRDCIGCHGEKGDGNGPAARFLSPKPRDFTKGIFKFANVAAGSLPHDADLVRTLRRGLHRSSMPAWELTPEEEISAVVAYVKTFSPRWGKSRPGAPIVPTEDPFVKKPQKGIELGRRVYHTIARCWGCHAAYETKKEIFEDGLAMEQRIDTFRENLYEVEAKESDWGDFVKPPDFLVDELKAGVTLSDLYRDVACGIGGTAMPMWRGALPEDQIWGLVYYVRSLVELRGTPDAPELAKRLREQAPFVPPPPAPVPAEGSSADAGPSPSPSQDTTQPASLNKEHR